MVSIIRETECRKKQTTGLSLIWGVQMAGMNFQTRSSNATATSFTLVPVGPVTIRPSTALRA